MGKGSFSLHQIPDLRHFSLWVEGGLEAGGRARGWAGAPGPHLSQPPSRLGKLCSHRSIPARWHPSDLTCFLAHPPTPAPGGRGPPGDVWEPWEWAHSRGSLTAVFHVNQRCGNPGAGACVGPGSCVVGRRRSGSPGRCVWRGGGRGTRRRGGWGRWGAIPESVGPSGTLPGARRGARFEGVCVCVCVCFSLTL